MVKGILSVALFIQNFIFLDKVPIDAPLSGTIRVEGKANVSGNASGLGYDVMWKFENVTKSISIQKTSRTMFIQTDRPIYKPGEASKCSWF